MNSSASSGSREERLAGAATSRRKAAVAVTAGPAAALRGGGPGRQRNEQRQLRPVAQQCGARTDEPCRPDGWADGRLARGGAGNDAGDRQWRRSGEAAATRRTARLCVVDRSVARFRRNRDDAVETPGTRSRVSVRKSRRERDILRFAFFERRRRVAEEMLHG
ncbi:hypothetical protein Syun_009732 [Stephania yunnanensis]|uniref:Uncharacterized protein n=1 Tax=Stephania yunnanensis TaxID=152371 RepID=A0AAP0KF26_9MAGN